MASRKKPESPKASLTTWTYQGQTYELDMNDLGTLARYDEAVTAMKSAFEECPVGATDARHLIAYCEGIRRMLDTLFGEGTADELLGDSQRPTDYDDVYESLTDFVHAQTAATAERRAKLLSKYKPQPNREQRRAVEQAVQQLAHKIEKHA